MGRFMKSTELNTINMSDQIVKEAIRAKDLCKVYPNGTVALKNVSLSVKENDFVVIIGLSGAGKSTLLRCLNRLIRPSSGELSLFGEEITSVNGAKLKQVRRRVGMIFQQFNLVRRLSVIENVLVGRLRFNSSPIKRCMSIFRQFSKSEREFAFECLKQVGIADLVFRRADALSGGQQQRVAIARALAQEPEVFLADEPIASLDPRSSETVMQILSRIHEEQGIPVMVNLHHIDFAKRYGKRILGMSSGEVLFDGAVMDLTNESISHIYGDKAEKALEELSAA
jgi:phosphonate transport system ATP-binding protein